MKNLLLITSIVFFLMTFSCKMKPGTEETVYPVFELVELWSTDTIFRTPESVRYDPESELLFVSNINSTPDNDEPNGFISIMDTDGNIIELEWVSGLKGPKGMGIYENKLYVADIDELVLIDIPSSKISKRVEVEGASFLNDVAVDKNGRVFFSDSNTGIIHIYEDGVVTNWITEGLDRPNGIYIENDRILLVSTSSHDLKIIDPETGEYKIVTSDIGRADGIEFTGYEGYYLASDWQGEIHLIRPDFSSESLLRTKEDEINTADIGINPAEHIVFIPTFFDNRVIAFKIEKN